MAASTTVSYTANVSFPSSEMTPPHIADAVAALEIHGPRPEGECYGRVSIMDSILQVHSSFICDKGTSGLTQLVVFDPSQR